MSATQTPSGGPSLRLNLGWALANLLRAYQVQVEAALAGLPGGARAFLVMSYVERETCQSQASIAERLVLDKTNLTYLLDGLEKAGLVRRVTDPGDRRNRHVGLTDEGTQALERFSKAVEQVERDLLSRLSREEAALFQQLVVRAAGLVENPSAPAGADGHRVCLETLGEAGKC